MKRTIQNNKTCKMCSKAVLIEKFPAVTTIKKKSKKKISNQ